MAAVNVNILTYSFLSSGESAPQPQAISYPAGLWASDAPVALTADDSTSGDPDMAFPFYISNNRNGLDEKGSGICLTILKRVV